MEYGLVFIIIIIIIIIVSIIIIIIIIISGSSLVVIVVGRLVVVVYIYIYIYSLFTGFCCMIILRMVMVISDENSNMSWIFQEKDHFMRMLISNSNNPAAFGLTLYV